jgi:SNF2 family DNA or RNA helicase
VERQAMDRTHRIGQTQPVFVHRLVAAGTVEEKILDKQARKQARADALFEADAKASEMILDEATLTDLFAPLA